MAEESGTSSSKTRKTVSASQGSEVEVKDVTEDKMSKKGEKNSWRRIVGFNMDDFSSWLAFNRWVHQPRHPSNLAALRVLFGCLMIIDLFTERGFSQAAVIYGSTEDCRFPLFDFLHPFSLPWMYMVYMTMVIGLIGIVLGLFYKFSCILYMTGYWYIFFLNKLSWNNHSYLYGLISFQLLLADANRSWSIDGLIWPKIRNAHVPAWNYGLLRFQIGLVYFLAGIKKLDFDWVAGYSMYNLSEHWVFAPFRLIMGADNTGLFVVHLGGLILDLSLGFVLYLDKTRIFGFIFGGMFHVMNSRIFRIGMFPYTMLATMPLFSAHEWPVRLTRRLPGFLRWFGPLDTEPQQSRHCLYTKEQVKPEEKTSSDDDKQTEMKSTGVPYSRPIFGHHLLSTIIILYVTTQCLLPFSHSITKGYNNWTNGLYGYSWDMMVHSWNTQHIRMSYKDKDTGEIGYLNPGAWTTSNSDRWANHADMLKQYGYCIQERLKSYNITNPELHIDVWKSMNQRFQQRMFDPRVNLLEASWHPMKPTPWLFPLLTELSNWREKLDSIGKELREATNYTDIVFVADFPGLMLENYIQESLGNTSLTVLKGQVIVEIIDNVTNITLGEGDKVQLPPGQFHNVHTVSEEPSCYMYIFTNTTHQEFQEKYKIYEEKIQVATENETKELTDSELLNDEFYPLYQRHQQLLNYTKQKQAITTFQRFRNRLANFASGVHHALALSKVAVLSIYSGERMSDIIQQRNISLSLEGTRSNIKSWFGVATVESVLELPGMDAL